MKTYKVNQAIENKYRGAGIVIEVRETCCLIRYNSGEELLTSFDLMNAELI